MRIYHNITETDHQAFTTFCQLYCENDFIDLCDTRQLPGPLDLNTQFPIGRFWRFQVIIVIIITIIIIVIIINIIIIIIIIIMCSVGSRWWRTQPWPSSVAGTSTVS